MPELVAGLGVLVCPAWWFPEKFWLVPLFDENEALGSQPLCRLDPWTVELDGCGEDC